MKEHFINGLNDEIIIAKIIKEITALKDTTEVNSEQVLNLAQRVETHRVHKAVLYSISNAEDFDSNMKR